MQRLLTLPVLFLAVVLSECTTPPSAAELEPTATFTQLTPTATATQPTSTVTSILPAPTATTSLPADVEECFRTAFTQPEMNYCSAMYLDISVEEMHDVFEEVVNKYRETAQKRVNSDLGHPTIKPEDVEMFVELQAQWEEWAKSECEFLWIRVGTFPDGTLAYLHGSMAPLLGNMCLAAKYQARIQELQDLLDDPNFP